MEITLVNETRKERSQQLKCQIQVKNNMSSKSFTVKGMDIDYAFELIFFMFKRITESKGDTVTVTCFKPPQGGMENGRINQ